MIPVHWKSPCALQLVCQMFPQLCVWNSTTVGLTDDGLFSPSQGRSSSSSSFHTSLLQAIDGTMYFKPAGNASSSSTLQIFRDASHLRCLLFSTVHLLGHFSLVCTGQYIYRNLRYWMSNINIRLSGPPIPHSSHHNRKVCVH